jgi:hypothetical protein
MSVSERALSISSATAKTGIFERTLSTCVRSTGAHLTTDDTRISIDLLNVAFGAHPDKSPDRRTAIAVYKQLRILYPTRTFRLICIDVPPAELIACRHAVIGALMHPARTVLDDSIACALWFAARGCGRLLDGEEVHIVQKRCAHNTFAGDK